MITPKTPLAKEGYPFIGATAFITLLCAILGYEVATFVSCVLTFFVVFFFRDPERFTPEDANGIICPADGKIIVIENMFDDKFLHGNVRKVSIFMNVFNVHVNRSPVSGTVEKIIHTPGAFYSADSEKGALQNEHCAALITTANGTKMACVQVAGLIARRIVCWLEPGDSVEKGKRIGLIRFGSRVDLYLPTSATINVQLGDKVKAGETILGHIP